MAGLHGRRGWPRRLAGGGAPGDAEELLDLDVVQDTGSGLAITALQLSAQLRGEGEASLTEAKLELLLEWLARLAPHGARSRAST